MQAQLALKKNFTETMGAADSLEPNATRLFERSFNPKTSGGLRAMFRREVTPLPSFTERYGGKHISNQHHVGMKTVPVAQISGTLNKEADFDDTFRPTQRHSENRWLRVATAMLRGVELPPIELVKVGDQYFVKDGHHRVSVARALGFAYLDAEVVAWEFND